MPVAPVKPTLEAQDYHDRFAAVYDTLYRERDVQAEARFAAELLDLTGDGVKPARVLDFGCGTGSHSLAFGELGLMATGFDVSPAMVAQARAKAESARDTVVCFECGEFADLCGQMNGHRFHAAVSFFNVFNCMDSPMAMLDNLRLIRSALRPGGLLLMEVWNGAAVFTDSPRPNVRHHAVDGSPDREMVRIMEPEVDRVAQRCTLRYRVLTLDRGEGRFMEFESIHRLHFLTPVQYRHLFELAKFELVDEFPKGKAGVPVSDRDWYISYLVRHPR